MSGESGGRPDATLRWGGGAPPPYQFIELVRGVLVVVFGYIIGLNLILDLP